MAGKPRDARRDARGPALKKAFHALDVPFVFETIDAVGSNDRGEREAPLFWKGVTAAEAGRACRLFLPRKLTHRRAGCEHLSPPAVRGRRALARRVSGSLHGSEPTNGPIFATQVCGNPDPLPASGAREQCYDVFFLDHLRKFSVLV